MFTMVYDISVGGYRLGMLDSVEIHRSVELLADTCTIKLPASEYNKTIDVESKIRRGDKVLVKFGYKETGIQTEFKGWLQRVGTDNGSITLECEDDLFTLRVQIPNKVLEKVSLEKLLNHIIQAAGKSLKVVSDYTYTYDKFVINNATAYDVLKKVQEDTGADIYIRDGTLYVRPPYFETGQNILYDFSRNVETADLKYMKASDRKVEVTVKATLPDGTVKEVKVGSTGGDSVSVISPSGDETSMKQRGEAELFRRSYDGYEGNITTWLIPVAVPGDSAELHDRDYPAKDGRYFISSVTTTFDSGGGKRKVNLGIKLASMAKNG